MIKRLLARLFREQSATPPKGQRPVGCVVKTRFGDVVILMDKPGRKYVEYKWASVNDLSKVGWIKVPFSFSFNFFATYPFVRLATPKEKQAGTETVIQRQQEKFERVSKNRDEIENQSIKPGDIVKVKYSNTVKNEIVLEVDYRAGKLAIVREYNASEMSKRRMLPTSICTKIADGGGSFNPNNPLYEKHFLHVPDFYKQGNRVAQRKPKRRGFSWDD